MTNDATKNRITNIIINFLINNQNVKTMLITRKSLYSGVEHTLDINITQEKLDEWTRLESDSNGPLIQEFFPELTADEREFILTGILADEWDDMFPEEDDDNIDDGGSMFEDDDSTDLGDFTNSIITF